MTVTRVAQEEIDKWVMPNGKVINPATGEDVTDPILAAAIREGAYFVYPLPPRVVINWAELMKARRPYLEVPAYVEFTEKQLEVFLKIANAEVWFPLRGVHRILGEESFREALKFVIAKKIPVYKKPYAPYREYVFSGDIVRALESCQIDLEADGGVWARYFFWREEKRGYEKAREKAKREGTYVDRATRRASRHAARAARLEKAHLAGLGGKETDEQEPGPA